MYIHIYMYTYIYRVYARARAHTHTHTHTKHREMIGVHLELYKEMSEMTDGEGFTPQTSVFS